MHVDYDQLAPTYNRRFASGGQEGPAVTLQGLVGKLKAERILEIGCGTGHWLSGLVRAGGQVHGLDLSRGMLEQAQGRGEPLHLARGRAGSPPYAARSFDLVYCVNAIHHFRDQAGFVRQAYRLLRRGGILALIGSDPHSARDVWYVHDYFAGTRETDLARFPSWGTVLNWMVGAGFERATWYPVDWIHDPKYGRAVLDDPFLKKDSCSQLALLSDEVYAAGLRRIEATLARAEAAGETVVFECDLTLGMLTAQKSLVDRSKLPAGAWAGVPSADDRTGSELET